MNDPLSLYQNMNQMIWRNRIEKCILNKDVDEGEECGDGEVL